jgi:hypothetical protein
VRRKEQDVEKARETFCRVRNDSEEESQANYDASTALLEPGKRFWPFFNVHNLGDLHVFQGHARLNHLIRRAAMARTMVMAKRGWSVETS